MTTRSYAARTTRLRTWLPALAIASMMPLEISCEQCDLSSCASSFSLRIEEQGNAPLVEGTYAIHLVADARSLDAECVVGHLAMSASCSAPDGNVSVDAPIFGDTQQPHRTFYLGFADELPAQISVRIEQDGTELANESFAPDYAEHDPTCAPGCVMADELVTLAIRP